MSSPRLACSSEIRLSALSPGARGRILDVRSHDGVRVARLFALGVTPGAAIELLQTFPALVFLCDQTEIAVERVVADVILIGLDTPP